MMAELICLALAVYHEARSEPLAGQLAVAQVVINRAEDPRYPDSLCEVVKQGGPAGNSLPSHRLCQFSFYCDFKSDRPYNPAAWIVALSVAGAAWMGIKLPALEHATHYHARYVLPRWAFELRPLLVIGQHIFYAEQR